MKYFATLLVVALIAGIHAGELSDEEKERLKEIHINCQKVEATKIPQDLLDKLNHGDWPSEPIVKSHIFCMSKNTGFQDDSGEPLLAVIKFKLLRLKSEAEVDTIIKECAVKKGSPEDTAWHMYKCWGGKGVVYHAE